MSTGTNKERIEQNNELLNQIKTTIDNLPSAGGTAEGIKQFSTVEEMQADTTAQEGDLAVVYRSEIQNATVDSKFQVATFPETVVLDTAITGNVEVRYRAVDSSKMFDCWGQLDSSRFMMDCYSDSAGEIRIQYTSSDGITYTRTRLQGDSGDLENPVDFGTEIYYEMPEMWNDAIGKFIQIGGNIFEGLYTYKPQHKTFKVAFPNFSTSTINITNKKFIINDTITTSYNKSIFKNAIGSNYCTYFIDTNNKLKCIVAKRTLNELAYDSSGNCVGICTSNVTSSSNYFTSAIMYDVDSTGELTNPVEYTCYTFDTTINIVAMNYTDFKSIPVSGSILASQGNASSGVFRASVSPIWSNSISTLVKADEYYLAPTQLTTISNDVYKSIFYGENGIESGTLTNNVDNSFADTNAEIYSKIQNQYENMEPRVLTDSDKTINKNIYFIPVKKDGTVLLDTSNVTSMYTMFQNCKNLATIPLLNTSNVTSMGGMFQDCTNLKTIPLLDTSNVTNMNNVFSRCTNLTEIPLLNTSSVTDMSHMFRGCTNLTTIPELNTSHVTNMNYMFYGCTNLTTIPLIDTSKVTYMNNMFYNCTNLSDESLNNILAMCKNATSYSDTKTLAYIGLTSDQANKCKTLSNYSAFTAAGWTTGY